MDIPLWLIFGTGLFAIVGSIIAWMRCNACNKWNVMATIWAAAFVFIIHWITVLGRLENVGESYRYNLMPLWSIDAIKDGYVETIYEKVYNVILFIPLGLICTGFKKWQYILLFGLCTSITIELLQFVTRTGMCETDDVICNAAGCIIGYTSVRLVIATVTQIRKLCEH